MPVVTATGPTATLRCDADPQGRTVYAQRVGALETVLPDTSGTFALTPGTWRLYADDGTFSLKLGDLVVTGSEVIPCTLARAEVRGRVRTPAGRPVSNVRVGGGECPITRSEDDGSFVIASPPAGCALTAWFTDGMLRRPSNTVVITPWLTGEVDLVLDDRPVAGLGIGIGSVRDGIQVRTVHPDTPAERAGLQAGDIIVSVDGTDLGESPDLNTFMGLGTGPEGGTVRLEVLRGEEMESFTLVRARIPAR